MRGHRLWVALILSLPLFIAHAEVKVCAVPQLYRALENLHELSPVEFSVSYAVSQDLYGQQVNKHLSCDLVFSDEEKLPVLLTRANLGDPYSLKIICRAPLILWSKDAGVVPDSISALQHSSFKSLAIADARLTPVGFSSWQVLKQKLPQLLNEMRYRLYKTEHEFLVYSMLKEGLVQCGFISKPLVLSQQAVIEGSYWEVPRKLAPDLLYYMMLSQEGINSADAKTFYNFMSDNSEISSVFTQAGFSALKD